MDFLCPVDGETLSRFKDGELSFSDYRELRAHVTCCASCTSRVDGFRLADGLVGQVLVAPGPTPHTGRLVASLSVAAALVATIATNVLLTPRNAGSARPGPMLSAAPSDTLTSFYEKVASPPISSPLM